jgi:hypothetical protein
MLQASIQGRTRMSRTPGPSEEFGTEDGVYCLGCRGSMKKEPLEEDAADNPAPVQANSLVNGRHNARELPDVYLFGPPPIESNRRQASSDLNSSHQGPRAEIGSARLENGNAESSSTSTSPPPNLGKGVCWPAAMGLTL